jgi:hypothetical protein
MKEKRKIRPMLRAADIAVFDEFGQILLLAEVRAPEGKTEPQWAADVRREISARMKGFVPRYFIVVARDMTYLWTSPTAPEALPDRSIATDELLAEYFERVGTSAATIPGSSMDLLVGMWLRDLTHGDRRTSHVLPTDLVAAAENGRIEFANAA